ncbi:putative secreted protein [Granulibacter bethesdensis]|uniref:DUF2141 domain-containing protein n=1 Tax=Granulibacter bethesdensis TaxID=364410 RepID=UPI00090C5C45|nr:DUF2141 domain-containing protein [Granulibacter bethesdensis]APH56026.1 putative secreted protein [Granulibacter bethesdensis]
MDRNRPAILKRLFSIIVLLALAVWPRHGRAGIDPCQPDDPHQTRLLISVHGMNSAAGVITITVYPDEAKHFLDGKYKLARVSLPVSLPVTHACIALPAPGFYAVALFHDANRNGHFDTTMLGLPAEGFGFSRNPVLLLGPPDLSAVRFATHPGDNVVDIRMKYY